MLDEEVKREVLDYAKANKQFAMSLGRYIWR